MDALTRIRSNGKHLLGLIDTLSAPIACVLLTLNGPRLHALHCNATHSRPFKDEGPEIAFGS
jgi:hypothetical protein